MFRFKWTIRTSSKLMNVKDLLAFAEKDRMTSAISWLISPGILMAAVLRTMTEPRRLRRTHTTLHRSGCDGWICKAIRC